MGLAIGQVDVHGKGGVSEPARSGAANAIGIFERPRIGCAGRKRIVCCADSGDGCIAGITGRAADDVVALGAIRSDPITLGGRVSFDNVAEALGEFTVTLMLPVIVAVVESVAVIDWEPAVLRVAEKVCIPASVEVKV